jgi:hypothetical protein
MNNLIKLWTALIKDACSKYAETHGILSNQHDGFRHHRSIHDALSSIIMIMEDAKVYKKDIYVMYADLKGAVNAAHHRTMFSHMCQICVPFTFVDTCEQLYGDFTTTYITPYGPTPSIDINRGTLHGDTLFPFLFTLSLEPFLRWLAVGSGKDTAQTPPPLTLTPHNPRLPTKATASPTTSASPRAHPPPT